MKKTITIFSLVMIVLACHRKTVPVNDTATIEKQQAESAHTELVAQGKTVYTNRCGRCHALKQVDNFTAERWTNILKAMIPKAKLNETEAQQVTAYVMENAKKG
jgi:mono/diheme cytochrome c family protein